MRQQMPINACNLDFSALLGMMLGSFCQRQPAIKHRERMHSKHDKTNSHNHKDIICRKWLKAARFPYLALVVLR